jgi:RNase P/RNase MRP subunit p30
VIYGFEELGRKDYLHQRASGLNHIMCELAKKNNIVIGFSYSQLLNNEDNMPTILGRMAQNIKLCQKYKVKTIIGSFAENPFSLRAPHDISNLFKLFGMNERNVNISFAYNL